MQIVDIKENGSSNIIRWALSNQVDIRNDQPLMTMINDETSYIVTLNGVNFLELFRMTSMYRDYIKIEKEQVAHIPETSLLEQMFQGTFKPEDDPSKEFVYSELAHHAMQIFVGMTDQMKNDNDIIDPGFIRLFLPMMTRKFTVKIPVMFQEVFMTMTEEEFKDILNPNYPKTLIKIIDSEAHSANRYINLMFVKMTNIIKYEQRLDSYINYIKYFPLQASKHSDIFKVGLLGFSKRNAINDTFKYNMFESTHSKEQLKESLTKIAKMRGDLELEFAVQLPIEYMQLLQNSFGRDILNITYESSIGNVMNNGIISKGFKIRNTPDNYDPNDRSSNFLPEAENPLSAYSVRINESNDVLLKTLPILLNKDNARFVDNGAVFSLLPSGYLTNSIISFKHKDLSAILNISRFDPVLTGMMDVINEISTGVSNDLQKMIER